MDKFDINKYNRIADQQGTRNKNQVVDKPEGLRQFLDHRWKAPGKDNRTAIFLHLTKSLGFLRAPRLLNDDDIYKKREN